MGSIGEANGSYGMLYRVSKAAVNMVAKLAHTDFAAAGMRTIALHPGWVRPRWEAQPEIWRNMLLAALQGNAAALQQSKLRGIQLLGAVALAPATTLRS